MIRTRLIRNGKSICVSLFFLLVSVFALGQGGVATGDLRVTVKDPKGDLVPNAVVKVRDLAKGVERAATGDGQGGYSARLLPPATYSVTVDAPGFSGILNTGVLITVGGLVDLPVTLSVATGKEVVEVTAQAELIETSRTSTTDTIGQRRIDNLPINGRNYINFTLTDSQVVRDNAPNTGAAPTSGLNMSGQRARSNLVNVDGADATDNSVNGVRSTVSQEAVQEFQIISNSYAAEYGRASGGVVNIITRSGSNDFHGDIFGYLRNRNFQAVNPFSTVPNPAYTRVQGGAAFGGPIKKDKTYFYFSYEITRRHETGFSSIGRPIRACVPRRACKVRGASACATLTLPRFLAPRRTRFRFRSRRPRQHSSRILRRRCLRRSSMPSLPAPVPASPSPDNIRRPSRTWSVLASCPRPSRATPWPSSSAAAKTRGRSAAAFPRRSKRSTHRWATTPCSRAPASTLCGLITM
jgi:hypothetical protein